MALKEERRHYHRFYHKTSMNLYRMDHQDQCSYAEMNDYSEGGLSLKTSEKLVLGHLVYLEMKNHDTHAKGPEKYSHYFGTITWASPDSDLKDAGALYSYGLEYLETSNSKIKE